MESISMGLLFTLIPSIRTRGGSERKSRSFAALRMTVSGGEREEIHPRVVLLNNP
jgi:hypothetical protein